MKQRVIDGLEQNVIQELEQLLDQEQIRIDEPMSNHTTFRVGGPADVFVVPRAEQIAGIVQIAKKHDIAITVIGNGSNLLVGDRGIRGIVINIGKNMKEVSADGNRIHIQAGASLALAAQEALRNSLGGMEFAAGIPGSFGGAVVMNAGAYGGEMKDIIESVKVLTQDGTIKELSVEELGLSYRHSCIIENNYTVLEGTVVLSDGDRVDIQDKMADFRERRISKQPLEYPSAGSTFKRPEGYFAGKLIMDAGLRGFSVGGAQVSEKHCGFVINKGDATAADICNLMSEVSRIVKEKFDVILEPEVKRIGEF